MKRLFAILIMLFAGLLPLNAQQKNGCGMPQYDSDTLAAYVVKNSDALTFDKYNNQHLGLYAPDFRFVTEEGGDTTSLWDLQTDSLIILFYDPDCSHCKKEIKKLRKNKKLSQDIAANKVKVLTIPPDITIKEWKSSVKRMPAAWINAWSVDNDLIIKKYLWKVPEMFTLDKDKRIIDINMYREYFDD